MEQDIQDPSLEDLINKLPSYSLPGGGRVKDADTFVNPDGKTMRLQGVDAYETAKVLPGKIQGSQRGADTQTQAVRKIITEGGYTKPVYSGQKDSYDRELGDYENEAGQKLSHKLIRDGLVNLNSPTQEQVSIQDAGRLERARRKFQNNMTPEDMLSNNIRDERNVAGIRAKQFTNTAKEFGSVSDEAGKSDYFTGPSFVGPDEDRRGFARSNLKTGLKMGLANTQQGLWDAMGMFGTVVGSEAIKAYGSSKGDALANDMMNLPNLKNGEALDENGDWNLKSFSEMGNYLIGQAANSAPQMAVSIASVLAAPATFGLSLTAPAAIYSGNTWRGQEGEKSVGWALTSGVTQAAVEKLGVIGVFASVFERSSQKAIIEQLMKKGMTQQAAEQALKSTTKEAMKDVAAAMRVAEGSLAKKVAKATGRGVVGEAPEEMIQELTQYFGEKKGFDYPTDTSEQAALHNRILSAGIGGATLGGAIGGGGKLVQSAFRPKFEDGGMSDTQFQQKFLADNGLDTVPTAENVTNLYHEAVVGNNEVKNLEEMAALNVADMNIAGVSGKAKSWWDTGGFKNLYRGFNESIMNGHERTGEAMAALGTLLGASRAFNGGSIDDQKRETQNKLARAFGSPDQLKAAFPTMSTAEISRFMRSKNVQGTIEHLIKARAGQREATLDRAIAGTNFDKRLTPEERAHLPSILKYAQNIDKFLTEYTKTTGDKLDVTEFMGSQLDKTKVANDLDGFRNLLVKKFGITNDQANDVTNTVVRNEAVTNVADSIDDMLNFDSVPEKLKAHLVSELNKPENKGVFDQYLSHDLFADTNSFSVKGGARHVNKNLIGRGGSKLASLLQVAQDKGEITPQEASRKAKEIKDWLDMRAGNYKAIKSPYIKFALDTVNFLTTITSLPLAAISSTVEFAQIYRNLNLPQSLKVTRNLLKGFGGEIGHIYKSVRGQADTSEYRESLFGAGYLHDGGIGRRNDIISGYYQKWTEGFFKMTGLTSVTNITRYAKQSIGADAINSWLAKVETQPTTQAGIDARDHLTRVGIDVENMLKIQKDNPANQQWYFDQMQAGVTNFVNEAVVNPSKINRPKFYSDPHLQLFTQFQGYISAFTAQILPRLLTDLRKSGSKDQINAATTIAMMFALAYLALYIKDMIKYGESPPTWLKEEKEFQRYIGQIGLMGTGQRVWDAISPVVPESERGNVFEKLYRKVSDQAPALAFINKVGDAITAPEGTGIKKTTKLLPIFSTSTNFANYLQKELGE